MAHNPVASNLLMVVILIGGLIAMTQIKLEVFPEMDLDFIHVIVPYPGASPAEVESGILLAIEEAVRGIDGVIDVDGFAMEGSGEVRIELHLGTNANKVLQDVKVAVDRLQTLPREAERPIVNLLDLRIQAISMVVYGDAPPRALRSLAEDIRDELLQDPEITIAEISDVPDPEISVEISQAKLREYGLTLDRVAEIIRKNALDLPAGGVKTPAGEILLRTAERRDYGREFERLRLLSSPDGADVRLGKVARVIDGFADTDQGAVFNGKPAIRINLYRVGAQTPMGVAGAAKAHIERIRPELPKGMGIAVWKDDSELLTSRLSLLTRNAFLGLVLVILVLGIFLEPRLAAWVTVSIPVSILGAFIVAQPLGLSINMISLMAFILTLGIVVDDAIVMGESIYEERRHGFPPIEAAIRGARLVAIPVVFSVLTNMIAFVPMLMIPGLIGKVFAVIPVVVIAIFFFSLVESLFILPAHLGHLGPDKDHGVFARLGRVQGRFARRLARFRDQRYVPALERSLHQRYLTVASGLAILIATIGFVASGRINFAFGPRVDADIVTANATLPYGTPIEETRRVQAQLLAGARAVIAERGAEESVVGIYSTTGSAAGSYGPPVMSPTAGGGHLTGVQVYLVPAKTRQIQSAELAREWRARSEGIIGVETLTFKYDAGPSSEVAIHVELSHPDRGILEAAGQRLAEGLRIYAGVKDIDDGVLLGKPQLDFTIRPEGRSAGITAEELGRQVRDSFYGAEALRQQRGRNEMKVMVRLPEAERRSLHDVESLILRTPSGGEIPLAEAADVHRGRAYTQILRSNGRRIINVTADVDEEIANGAKIVSDVKQNLLPRIQTEFPGLLFAFGGEQRDIARVSESMIVGFALALIAIFATLAIPFGSYVQPLIVMAAIPFGIVGAVFGHVLMGYDLSIVSVMGMIALSGVVVNDSLVLIDAANQRMRAGMSPFEAMCSAGSRRFRPILLTSLTTFFGLVPMIFEQSMQARILIPLAISLGFGVLFTTVIVLLLVPALFLIIEDMRTRLGVASVALEPPVEDELLRAS